MTFSFLLTTFLAVSRLFTSIPETLHDLNTLSTWLTGSFSSQQRAAADTNYYDIRLEMALIWGIEI